jgi:hypothetical protein
MIGLSPLTVLIGANNAGKSSVFDALVFANQLTRGVRPAGRFAADSFIAQDSSDEGAVLSVGLGLAPSIQYEVRIDPAAGPAGVAAESLRSGGAVYAARGAEVVEVCPDSVARTRFAQEVSVLAALRKARADVALDSAEIADFLSVMSSLYRYRLVPHLLRQTADDPSSDFVPALGTMGEGLPAVLYQMKEHRPASFEALLDRLHESIIGFRGLEFVSDPSSSNGLRLSIEFNDSRGSIDVNNVSDGTMTTVGLAALVSHPHPPRLVLLEEPEMGLSPSSTTRVAGWLRDYAERCQVIVASHSPYFVSAIYNAGVEGGNRSDIRVISLDSQGRVAVAPLREGIEATYGSGAGLVQQGTDRIAQMMESI